MREFRLRENALAGVKDFAYSRIIFAMPESAMKRANAHYDLAKWDIKFPPVAA